MHIEIVPSKDADVIARLNSTVQSLHAQRYPNYFKTFDKDAIQKDIANSLAQENWFASVAYDGTKPVGYIMFFIRDYEENPYRFAYKGIHIDQISVEEEYRHYGIGSLLIQKAEAMGKQVGATQMELTFWDKNEEAKAFYAQKGFEEGVHFIFKKI